MKSILPLASGFSRRVLLSALATIPVLIGPLRPISASAQTAAEILPSWNDGSARASIINFVARVTTPGGADFVPVEHRIATFDNDGTLWCEQPMYTQLAFVLDRVKQLAPQNPNWVSTQPFKAVLEGDMPALATSGERGLMALMAATHAGMSSDEFATIVSDWIASARDPRFKRPYTELIYQPMLELLTYLHASGFKTFIVSGGGVEFMRPWAQGAYGVPPEQVLGSSIKTRFEMRDGRPVLFRLPEIDFVRQARGDQSIHRSPADRRVRKLRWRSRNAAMDDATRQRSAPGPDCPSHRCGA
jgi:hypothetical protein